MQLSGTGWSLSAIALNAQKVVYKIIILQHYNLQYERI